MKGDEEESLLSVEPVRLLCIGVAVGSDPGEMSVTVRQYAVIVD